jgi:hydroxyquinol 1,2-dioxygenase
MIADDADLTRAVLAEAGRTPDARLREILVAAITHLHAFVREAKLTEGELQQVLRVIAQAGQASSASHNEVVLASGSLGVSALVCLLNHRPDTTANLMGPFWRAGSPLTPNGGSIVRSPTPGEPIFVGVQVLDGEGAPVEGAEVDVWHASPEGFYENQDPQQADMNLRGSFVTDAQGCFSFRSVKPVGYPVPVNGPVGALLRAQGRHNMRPAHLHFLIRKPGFRAQFSQVYSADDPTLETDVQFGVTRALTAHYERHDSGTPPAADVNGPWYTLERRFVLERGEPKLPPPPISAKSDAPRPVLTVLRRL